MPTRWATVQHKEPDREEETCHPVDIKKTTILAKNRAVLACLSSTPTKRPFSAPLGLDDAESARARALEVSSSPETRGRRGDLESRKIESVSRVSRPARPSTEDYVKTHYLRQSDLRKVQSIPYISPIKNDVPLPINAQQG